MLVRTNQAPHNSPAGLMNSTPRAAVPKKQRSRQQAVRIHHQNFCGKYMSTPSFNNTKILEGAVLKQSRKNNNAFQKAAPKNKVRRRKTTTDTHKAPKTQHRHTQASQSKTVSSKEMVPAKQPISSGSHNGSLPIPHIVNTCLPQARSGKGETLIRKFKGMGKE